LETTRFVVKTYRIVSPRRRNERDRWLGRRLRASGTHGSPRWRFWLEQQFGSHESGPDRTTPTLQLTEIVWSHLGCASHAAQHKTIDIIRNPSFRTSTNMHEAETNTGLW